jgi:hypothetical protein
MGTAGLAITNLAPVLLVPQTDARCLVALLTHKHDVRRVDRHLLREPTALRIPLTPPDMFVDAIDSLNHDLAPRAVDADHARPLARIIARDYLYQIINFDSHQTTSLAKLTIFMKLRSRNSRATAPKIRVPRGFLSLSMITTALLSNRM